MSTLLLKRAPHHCAPLSKTPGVSLPGASLGSERTTWIEMASATPARPARFYLARASLWSRVILRDT